MRTQRNQPKPWEVEGISRRTWFRRKAREKAPAGKTKGSASPSRLTGIDIKAAETAATPVSIESAVRERNRPTLDSLKTVMLYSDSETARVAAANTILDRGFGKPSIDTGIDMALPLFGQEFLATPHGETIQEARKLAPLAIMTLDRICQCSPNHSARVAAARSLLNRGLGTVAPARLDVYRQSSKEIGKKQAAIDAATTAGVGTEWGDDLMPLSQIN